MKKPTLNDDQVLEQLVSTVTLKKFTKTKGNLLEFYLCGEILDSDFYVDWFDQIRNASANDTIKLYINSPGGNAYTAIQFLRCMGDCDADIICSVEGCCMSAATMIFLAADGFEVTPNSAFMFHNYSSGTYGKGGEQYDQIQFERTWSEQLLTQCYQHFLTEEEIHSMLHNKDIWLTSEQVIERLERRSKLLSKGD